ncbi:MAG: response regulator [Bradymonadia bacterium]
MHTPPIEPVLRLVMDAIPQCVFWKSREFVYLGCNKNFARVAGLSDPSEIVGLTDEMLPWSSEETLRFRSDDRRVMESGEARFNIVEHLMDAEGKRRWLETNKIPLRDPEGQIYGVLGTFEDVTHTFAQQESLKRLNGQLRQIQRFEQLGGLLKGIAHDFNNLLTTISVQSELIQNSADDQETLHSSTERILASVASSKQLCQQMSVFAGDEQVVLSPLNIGELFHGANGLIRALVPQNTRFNVTIPEHMPTIDGDTVQLRQLVLNLLSNAAEATSKIEHPRISIEAFPHMVEEDDAVPAGEYVALQITDNGRGIPNSLKEKIFEPCFSTHPRHTGLGLSMAREIAHRHTGHLILVDSAPGQTIFRVLLPQQGAMTPLPQSLTPEGQPTAFEGRCLLVDDEPLTRRSLSLVLQRAGFEVIEATNGLEGIALHERHAEEISVVVLDVTMPGMGGIEALSRMRMNHPGTPVVLMSGYADKVLDGALFGDWHPVFLQKPFNSGQLFESIIEALSEG